MGKRNDHDGYGSIGNVNFCLNLCCVVLCHTALAVCYHVGGRQTLFSLNEILAYALACTLPAMGYDAWKLLRLRRLSQGPYLPVGQSRPISWVRVAMKLGGLWGAAAMCRLAYALFSEYDRGLYIHFFALVDAFWPVFAFVSIPYTIAVDKFIRNEKDGSWHTAALCLFHPKADIREALNYLRSWIVKFFFLPIMLIFFTRQANFIATYPYVSWFSGNFDMYSVKKLYIYLYELIFAVDLYSAAVGYICTFKLLHAHIRSTEHSLKGWFVCMMCYEPFWQALVYARFLKYEENYYWGDVWWGNPWMYTLWAAAIIVLGVVYASSSLTAGYRFSNLTYRGLLTSWPYALTRHPAYVAKNIMWWMVSVPFITNGSWVDAVQNSALLACVNVIYFLRARTEEVHLSRFKEYRVYATLMNKKSLFAPLGRLIPALRFPKEGREWKQA